VKATLTAKRNVVAAITAAATLSILAGCGLAWVVFSTHLPARVPYAGLAPAAALLVIYSVIAVARLSSIEDAIVKLLGAALAGLFVALAVGAALIQMIGCRYDVCINL
jgi:hypothetical protein